MSNTLAVGDRLHHMFEMQQKLNINVSPVFKDIESMSDDDIKYWLERFNSAQTCESGEFWETFGRWWRAEDPSWKEKAAEEAVDELHFLMSKFLLLGLSSEDVYEIYLKKNRKNFTRSDWDRDSNLHESGSITE